MELRKSEKKTQKKILKKKALCWESFQKSVLFTLRQVTETKMRTIAQI